MTRVEVIIKMKGADVDAAPIETDGELIFAWDIDLNLDEFSDEQIEQFYDVEVDHVQE